MALKSMIESLVKQTISSTIDDLKDTVTHRSNQGKVYDVDAGKPTTAWADQPGLDVAIVRVEVKEVDTEINALTDMKILLPSLGTTNEPKKSDQFIRADGSILDVIKVKPVTGLYSCFVRKLK